MTLKNYKYCIIYRTIIVKLLPLERIFLRVWILSSTTILAEVVDRTTSERIILLFIVELPNFELLSLDNKLKLFKRMRFSSVLFCWQNFWKNCLSIFVQLPNSELLSFDNKLQLFKRMLLLRMLFSPKS